MAPRSTEGKIKFRFLGGGGGRGSKRKVGSVHVDLYIARKMFNKYMYKSDR